MKILVIGGTRFFGKRLVDILIEEGCDVTLLTRGETPDPFGGTVRRLRAHRSSTQEMISAVSGADFDVIYDQICFSPDDAQLACSIFSGRVGRYIFTSSMYVYSSGSGLVEGNYDPSAHPLRMGNRDALSYEDGKRYAEGVFLRDQRMPVVCVRFPIVMGYDDYTGRFTFHVGRVLTGTPILIPVPRGYMNYISADMAARFLCWVKGINHRGPINAACPEALTAEDIVTLMGGILGRIPCIIQEEPSGKTPLSPYHRSEDMVMNTDLATRLGFTFPSLSTWFAGEVARASVRLEAA